MKSYALIIGGVVTEIIEPRTYDAESPVRIPGEPSRIGSEIPIDDRYPQELVSMMIEITDIKPLPKPNWSYKSGEFFPEPIYQPSSEEILASQSANLQALIQIATSQKNALKNRIDTLQDAIELEMANQEEIVELPLRQDQLVSWKKYAVLLGRVTFQSGWPSEVDLPKQPDQGMDLSVSAVAKSLAAS